MVATSASKRWARSFNAAAVPLLLIADVAVLAVFCSTSLGLLAAAGGGFGWICTRVAARTRALAALTASAVFVATLFVLRVRAHDQVRELLGPEIRGAVVDVVLSPEPAEPRCWSVIVVERDEKRRQFVLYRGTLSLAPGWNPTPGVCAAPAVATAGGALGGPEAARARRPDARVPQSATPLRPERLPGRRLDAVPAGPRSSK